MSELSLDAHSPNVGQDWLIPLPNNQICVKATHKSTSHPITRYAERSPAGVGGECFRGRNSFVRTPWIAIWTSAVDEGVHALEWVGRFYREIGATEEWSADLSEGVPWIEERASIGAEPRLRHGNI